MKDFLNEWLEKKVDPEKLSRYTVKNDKYDREDVTSMLEQLPNFDASREKLVESKAGDLGYDIFGDLFWTFNKVDPKPLPDEEIRPTRQINRMVREEAEKLPDHRELRSYTSGDPIGSALADITIEPDVETLYDKLEKQIEEAKELERLQQELAAASGEKADVDEMFDRWTAENADGSGTGEDGEPSEAQQQQKQEIQDRQESLQEQIDKIMAQVQEQSEKFDQSLDHARAQARAAMGKALEKAVDEQETMTAMSEAWGHEPGELHRLPAAERIELAKKLNNKKFRSVCELFGCIKRFAFAMQRRRVNSAHEEIYDVELGDDLHRILPFELAKIGDPDQEDLFFKDFLEKNLPQYKMRGYERVAKGGIIYCHDGSGSMAGEQEYWAKACGLAFLHIAKKQERSFWGIQFGSESYGSNPAQIRVDDFSDSKNINPQTVIDFAEFFFGGGTSFMDPLNVAMGLLQKEHDATGFLKSDIVFATDGHCDVTDEWMKQFKAEQKRLDFKVWGIVIGNAPTTEPLNTICDGKVFTVKNLVNGEDLRDIFAGIGDR